MTGGIGPIQAHGVGGIHSLGHGDNQLTAELAQLQQDVGNMLAGYGPGGVTTLNNQDAKALVNDINAVTTRASTLENSGAWDPSKDPQHCKGFTDDMSDLQAIATQLQTDLQQGTPCALPTQLPSGPFSGNINDLLDGQINDAAVKWANEKWY